MTESAGSKHLKIIISGSRLQQCSEFAEYLLIHFPSYSFSFINDAPDYEGKDPYKLSPINYTISLLYFVIVSKYYVSILHSITERISRLNILKYLLVYFLRSFYSKHPKSYNKFSLFLLNHLLSGKGLSLSRKKRLKNKATGLIHFHLGTLTTDHEINYCLESYASGNFLHYLSYNWDNLSSKTFLLPIFDSAQTWDPYIAQNYPPNLYYESKPIFSSSFRLSFATTININETISKKINCILFLGTQKDPKFELSTLKELVYNLSSFGLPPAVIYRPHPFNLEFIYKELRNFKDVFSNNTVINTSSETLFFGDIFKSVDDSSLYSLFEKCSIVISPGSTTLLEATFFGCMPILLSSNPRQVTLKFMHQKDHMQSLLSMSNSKQSTSLFVLFSQFKRFLSTQIDYESIHRDAMDLYNPFLFDDYILTILSSALKPSSLEI